MLPAPASNDAPGAMASVLDTDVPDAAISAMSSAVASGPFAALTAWFADTDREVPLEGRPAGGATRFELELPPYGAAIVARMRA